MSGVLVRQQIVRLIRERNLIENADINQCVSPASYELRVGSYRESSTSPRIDLQKGEAIALMPNGFLLVGTMERVTLPLDVLGLMYLRSTYARRGFVSWFQGIVDPGYSGNLTVVLHNLSSELILLEGEERICHLVFQQLPEAVDKGYEGAYQGSDGATPPRRAPAIKVVGATIAELGGKAIEHLLKNPEIIRQLTGGR